jgi:hypothetical protein
VPEMGTHGEVAVAVVTHTHMAAGREGRHDPANIREQWSVRTCTLYIGRIDVGLAQGTPL